jgi:hypothetical protein
MAVTTEDLREFARFADQQLKNGGSTTMVELANLWESQRLNGDQIQVDIETVRELAKFFPDVQDEEQLKRAIKRRGGVTTAEMLGKAMLAAVRAGRA